ncbi:hypothetical protein GCM10011348_17880 [Marinobacterium nitratireducens]|uniref:Uncharacterized protein n=1 Tax=Marinobacterium nitratireducens TaxID=518897 RepID=A0A917ZD84_9GAMM|nr:hypothetical protein GCM10011348_17880 [Marinobacterium nitratireducens]
MVAGTQCIGDGPGRVEFGKGALTVVEAEYVALVSLIDGHCQHRGRIKAARKQDNGLPGGFSHAKLFRLDPVGQGTEPQRL